MQKKNQPTNKQINKQTNKQNKTKENKKEQQKTFASTIFQSLFSRGVPFLPPPSSPPPRLLVVIKLCVDFAWLHNSYIHSSGDMLQTMIILFSTDWTMAGMKTLLIIFVIMFPVAMITQEDVNHGGNN